MLSYVKRNGLALQYASESMPNYEAIVTAAVKQNKYAFEYAYPQQLRDLNIDFPVRFSDLDTLRTVIRNRQKLGNDPADTRPLAVMIFTKKDHNGFFEADRIKGLIAKGYRVIYYEANTDIEAISCLKSATITIGQKAALISFSGHGSKRRIEMGPSDPRLWLWSEGTIDLADKLLFKGISRSIIPGGKIILDSCSTMAGGKEADNMRNFFAQVFPNATIYAPLKTTYKPPLIIYKPSGEIQNVFFNQTNILGTQYLDYLTYPLRYKLAVTFPVLVHPKA